MAQKIRVLRHWKQRFDPNAAFVFRKTTVWDGRTTFQAGDLVPEGLLPAHRLRRFWEAGRIELAEFDEPLRVDTGFNHAEDNPERAALLREVSVVSLGGNWYLVSYGDDDYKERGKEALDARLDAIRNQIVAEQAERAQQAERDAQTDHREGGAEGGAAVDGPPLSVAGAEKLTMAELKNYADPLGLKARSKRKLISKLMKAGVVGDLPDPAPAKDSDPEQTDVSPNPSESGPAGEEE